MFFYSNYNYGVFYVEIEIIEDHLQMYVFIYYSMNIFAIALFKESEDVIVTMQLLESSDKVEGLILL